LGQVTSLRSETESALTPAGSAPILEGIIFLENRAQTQRDMDRPAHSDAPLPSADTGVEELTQERLRLERRHWWVRGYSIFVIVLLTFAVISLTLPALMNGAETFFRIKLREAVFGLIALIVLFNIYTIYQEILIQRLRRQLLEKQDHSYILRNLAMIDSLTGLYNRRFGEQRLAAEVSRSERRGHPLTLLLLDLDDFKEINDTYGHAAGDQVLQYFASQLNNVIRGSDLAVRLGGDEFLALLPECTTEQLNIVLNRLGSLETDWQGNKLRVNFSAGWTEYKTGDHLEELLARADEALYATKRAAKKPAMPSKTAKVKVRA
jgi:diguanylate cyclase (GGDEF)-like protein